MKLAQTGAVLTVLIPATKQMELVLLVSIDGLEATVIVSLSKTLIFLLTDPV